MAKKRKPTGTAAIPVVDDTPQDEITETTAAEETLAGKEAPQPDPESNEPILPKKRSAKKASSPKAQSNGPLTTSTVVALIKAATAYGSFDEAIELLQAINSAK